MGWGRGGWTLGGVLALVVLRGSAEGLGSAGWLLPVQVLPIPAGRSGDSTSLACPRLPGRALCQRNRGD